MFAQTERNCFIVKVCCSCSACVCRTLRLYTVILLINTNTVKDTVILLIHRYTVNLQQTAVSCFLSIFYLSQRILTGVIN